MPRTQAEIEKTEANAIECGYEEPPEHLHPKGLLDQDDAWSDLVDYWRGRNIDWGSALLVYISRRFDVSIGEAYMSTDNFVKHEALRIDKLENPEDFANGFDGKFN